MTPRLLPPIVAVLPLVAAFPGIAAAQDTIAYTRSIGIEAHYQHYEEPSLGVTEQGPFVGIAGEFQADYRLWMARLDGRLAYGNMEYEGSGTVDDIDDLVAEARLVFGRALPFGTGGDKLTPYFGYGYRRLVDYLGGKVTSTGAAGYDRLSQYHYLPIGVEGLFGLNAAWSVKPSVEYDYFIMGSQDSYLSQAVAGLSDVHNDQSNGYGLRAALLFVTGAQKQYEFGPFVRYWNIDRSDIAPVSYNGVTVGGGYEPANETIEAGFAFKLRF